MKKITSFFASLLLVFTTAAFAEANQSKAALHHASAAAVEGKSGRANELVKHAGLALENALAAALVANGAAQKNLEAAANELEEAINQGNLNHSETATGHVETAISYLKEANK